MNEVKEQIDRHNQLVSTEKFKTNRKNLEIDCEVVNEVWMLRIILQRKGYTWDDNTQLIEWYPEYKPLLNDKVRMQKETEKNKIEMDEIREYLSKCTVKGNTVKLQERKLDRGFYEKIKKHLEKIGGKWKGGLIQAFVFEFDPSELLNSVVAGNERNIKKEFQFFETPSHLADKLVAMAFESPSLIGRVLEPSAGRGSIINAIHRHDPEIQVYYYELIDINLEFIKKIRKTEFIGKDFINEPTDLLFSQIIANPPFSKNQDIDHILKMYSLLEPGGKLVSIASLHWQISSNKKETQFRQWLEDVNANIENIPAGEFKNSGTSISTCIIEIEKQEAV